MVRRLCFFEFLLGFSLYSCFFIKSCFSSWPIYPKTRHVYATWMHLKMQKLNTQNPNSVGVLQQKQKMTKNTSNHAIKYIDPNYVLVCIHCNIMSPNRGGRGERRRRRRKKRRKPETPKRKRRAEKKDRQRSSEIAFELLALNFVF